MSTTPSNMPMNSGRWVGSVPALAGTARCEASDPASPSTKIIGTNRLSNITTPSTPLYQTVLTDNPAKADPLLFDAEVNAYSTSDNPCGPGLRIDACSPDSAIARPVPINTSAGVVR